MFKANFNFISMKLSLQMCVIRISDFKMKITVVQVSFKNLKISIPNR